MPDREERGRVLVVIAREAIGERLGVAERRWRDEPWLAQPAATFVTLRIDEDLRGCIGSLEARRPLGEDVAANARAAAFSDPRFGPLTPGEFARVAVEVSVLSARTPLEAASEGEAASRLRPGVDGVYLEYGDFSATFLPQVWESLPDPVEFLAALRHKARLPARFWDPALRLARYTVEKYGDGCPAR
ncbi:MAG TPA: AmmeMemoRadiSam system protein A [Usitatibacteraceae bacterium]|nr:AmmeMemoRadiSam system protein A [Burkholderiales bacterium]HQY46554.1 AmmeMemoRadiSam system protein A [Usitatibacteraceae bacterium]